MYCTSIRNTEKCKQNVTKHHRSKRENTQPINRIIGGLACFFSGPWKSSSSKLPSGKGRPLPLQRTRCLIGRCFWRESKGGFKMVLIYQNLPRRLKKNQVLTWMDGIANVQPFFTICKDLESPVKRLLDKVSGEIHGPCHVQRTVCVSNASQTLPKESIVIPNKRAESMDKLSKINITTIDMTRISPSFIFWIYTCTVMYGI